jgi:hypothetical protein
MKELILFFSLKNFYSFIFLLFFHYIQDIIIYLILIILLFLYVFFLKLINHSITNKIHNTNIDYYIYNKRNYHFSILIIVLFTIFYLFNFRLLVFLSERNYDFNILETKTKIILYCCYLTKNYYLIAFFFVCFFIFIIYIIVSYLFQIILTVTKNHYLKLHYYVFRRNFKYNIMLNSMSDMELKISDFFGIYYIYFLYFRKYCMIIILIIVLIYSFFKFPENLKLGFKFMPYYGLYQFCFNIYIFVVTKIQNDFEILVMESYYKDINFIMEKDEEKKLEYKRYLLSNFSKYKFKDSVYFYFLSELTSNCLLIQTNKYTINKIPNDFFSRIKNVKPFKNSEDSGP